MTHHMRNIAKYIDRQQFDIYLATAASDSYFHEIAKYISADHIFTFTRAGKHYDYDPVSGDYYHAPDTHPLYDWLKENQIDIIHDHRGGGTYFPLNAPQIIAKKVDSNVFGGWTGIRDGLSKTMCISQGVYNEWSGAIRRFKQDQYLHLGTVVYPAVDYPETTEDLRSELGIAKDTIVIGRSSMGYAGDEYNFRAYKQVESSKTLFLTPFLNERQMEFVRELGIKNIIVLPFINDYLYKSKFYNTLDVAAHHRGESFGCCVAEAMIHGKPVVTVGWCSKQYTASTAQEELIEDPLYCAIGRNPHEQLSDYANILNRLISGGRDFCKQEGQAFFQRAISKFAAPQQVKKTEQIYKDVING